MSLSVGDRLHKVDKDGNPISPDVESHVVWDVVEASSSYQARDDDGEFTHTHQTVVIRKVK